MIRIGTVCGVIENKEFIEQMNAMSRWDLIKLSKAPVKVVDVFTILVIASMLHHGLCCDGLWMEDFNYAWSVCEKDGSEVLRKKLVF